MHKVGFKYLCQIEANVKNLISNLLKVLDKIQLKVESTGL